MSEQLRNRLAEIAEDAPSAGLVLQTVRVGHQRRLHRRRWAAAVGAAVVVVATVAATTLVRPWAAGPSGREMPAVSTTVSPSTRSMTTLGTRAAVSPVPLADGTRLIRYAGQPVTSPVSVPSSWVAFDTDGPDVSSTPTSLLVNWTGAEPTAMQTLDEKKGTTGTGQYRGYLITTAQPSLDVFSSGDTATSASESITVDGHPARLLTAPKGSFDNTYATPTAGRVVWQLPDGRWISVWAVGEDRGVLTAFASALTDRMTAFPPTLAPGLTVQGYTAANRMDVPFVSQMAGPTLSLCDPQAPTDQDIRACLRLFADVDDGSFPQGVVEGSESTATFLAESRTVVVGGQRVQVNTKWQVAWTRWGASNIAVSAPAKITLTSADLAALAASVQLSPKLGVVDQPNPIVESSLAQESAQAWATSTR